MKNAVLNILFALIFLAGLCIMLYPTVSNMINRRHQSTAIAGYEADRDKIAEEDRATILEEAREYNKNLPSFLAQVENKNPENSEVYNNILNISNSGIMGVITIDCVDIRLPIYHGTSEAVLQDGAGHLATTSLPVGGENTHAVISAHTGLPSAKLFTDIDQLKVGDVFRITVLDEVLVYQVDDIKVVLPHEVSSLNVVSGKDYVTLVTCTPYGVNSHRLLVRGTRIEETVAEEEGYLIPNEAVMVDKTILIPIVVVPFIIVYFIWTTLSTKKTEQINKAKESE